MAKTTPLDLLKPSQPRSTHEQNAERMSICEGCPRLKFKVCQECGCFMPAKVTLQNAECPLGKW